MRPLCGLTKLGKYVTSQEFNKLTSEIFATNDIAKFVKKIDFDVKPQSLNKKILQIKQNMYILKMNKKNYRHLNQVFLLIKSTFLMT